MTAVSGKSPLEHRNLSSSPLEGNPSMINPVDLCSGGESGHRVERVERVDTEWREWTQSGGSGHRVERVDTEWREWTQCKKL